MLTAALAFKAVVGFGLGPNLMMNSSFEHRDIVSWFSSIWNSILVAALSAAVVSSGLCGNSPNPTPTPRPKNANIGSTWTDRRPIGRIIFAQRAKATATNLNGWNNGGPGTIGVAAFQADIMALVNNAISNTLSLNGQGIIIWDITGDGCTNLALSDEYYLGDPRFLSPVSAALTVPNSYNPFVAPTSKLGIDGIEPAMNAIADEVFAAIRSAGLKCGVALRAEKVYVNSNGDLDGSGGVTGEDQVSYDTILNQLADLDAKLSYAYNRWGCRMFYVDSNAASNDVLASLRAELDPTWSPAWLYTQLRSLHPDCVLFPEEHFNGAFTYSGPYSINDPAYQYERMASRYTELDNQWQSPFIDSGDLAAVPDSFTLISCANMGTSDPADTPNVVYALQHNQAILMADVWWNDPSITLVRNWQAQAAAKAFP